MCGGGTSKDRPRQIIEVFADLRQATTGQLFSFHTKTADTRLESNIDLIDFSDIFPLKSNADLRESNIN